MSGVSLVLEFFRHHAMMNRRLVDACRQLSPEQLGVTTPGTFGSIAATLVHVANAQEGSSARFLGTQRPEPLPDDPFPGFDVLAGRLGRGDALLQQAAAQLAQDHEGQLTGDDPPDTWRMPASLLLLQGVDHGTEHRSQMAMILTQLGVEPPEMDGWTYFMASHWMVSL